MNLAQQKAHNGCCGLEELKDGGGVFFVLSCNSMFFKYLFLTSEKIPTKIPTKLLRWGVRVGGFFVAAPVFRVSGQGAFLHFGGEGKSRAVSFVAGSRKLQGVTAREGVALVGFREQYARGINFRHCRKLRRYAGLGQFPPLAVFRQHYARRAGFKFEAWSRGCQFVPSLCGKGVLF